MLRENGINLLGLNPPSAARYRTLNVSRVRVRTYLDRERRKIVREEDEGRKDDDDFRH